MKIQKLSVKYVKKISNLCIDSFLEKEYSYYLQKYNLKGLDSFIEFCSEQNLKTKFDDSHVFLGAFEENTLVGVATININSGKLLLLFVDKQSQGLGYGHKLLGEAEKLLKDKAQTKISVDSTHFGIDFYKANGFVVTAEEKVLKDGMIFTTLEKKIK